MIKAAAYYCDALLDPVLFDQVYNVISPQRRKHVDEAKNYKTRCERLGASHILEKLLWENHIERPYEYSFTEQGKPILANHEGIYFSLTHSKGIAAAVISDCHCGIDIEQIVDYKAQIAHRFFTKHDVEFIESWDRREQPRKFMEVWTFKEAISKMMDRPLPFVLQGLDFHEYCQGAHGKYEWSKLGFMYQDFFMTICYEGAPEKIQMKLYNPIDGKYY